MGGYGSGRSGHRRIAEHCRRIDIRLLRKWGYLRPGAEYTLRWNVGGDDAGSISAVSLDHLIRLSYTLTVDEISKPVTQEIQLSRTPCRFGGARAWMHCPNCRRRSLVLYMAGERFYCRTCARVGYAAENESISDRAWRRINKATNRLNEDGSKPKWMRLRTYERLQIKADDAEALLDQIALTRWAQVLAQAHSNSE